MSKQNKIIIAIAAGLIAIGLILMARDKTPQDNNGATVRPIDAADHVFGNPSAPIKMIVYSDFQCPFCSEFADTMKKIEAYFTDKVVVTFRHYPLPGHPQAEKAAEASECAAEQGKFWEMHDKLFADNVADNMSVEKFKQDAAELGLDTNKFNQCLDSGQYAAKVAEQKAEGGRAGVTGTPTSFLSGNVYPGAYPFEDFKNTSGQMEKGMKNIISELLQ